MDFFSTLTLLGGLSLFLFGMSVMGQALERRAGTKLRGLLGRLTTGKLTGLLTGLCVTAAIQSSSAAAVMVVGFVNSGVMTLRQAIHVIMGANIGTTATAWLLSLTGIDGGNFFVQLLKPASFTPILALLGIGLYLSGRGGRRRDSGLILLGFATLMTGMETMSGAVSGLREVPAFGRLFLLFQNPLLGILAGAVLTAVIQSSSASVGILQALAAAGQVTCGAAVPLIMGQNIGTCVTAMISSVGANRNAKRAALVHLSFNVLGTAVCLAAFWPVKVLLAPAFLEEPVTQVGIAAIHSVFNVLCTALILPLSGVLERLVTALVPGEEGEEPVVELDERLFATPSMALERSREVAAELAEASAAALRGALDSLVEYSPKLAESVREQEERTDRYEDLLNTYLVKLSARRISGADSREAAKLLKATGDFERIADHAVNLLESAEELRERDLRLTDRAMEELSVLSGAVREVLDGALASFLRDDLEAASDVEPLEQVIDRLKEELRTRHILRLQRGECSASAGFIWSDLLTDLERAADHCSNIAGCVMELAHENLNLHQSLRELRSGSEAFREKYEACRTRYRIEN